MNPKTHLSEEAFDELCREIVKATQASDADIHAAANAPFLYQRLRAQIAAESSSLTAHAPQRSSTLNFAAALGALQTHWRWLLAAAAVGAVLLALMGWRGLLPTADVPVAVKPVTMPSLPATPPATPVPVEAKQLAQAVPAERKVVPAARPKAARLAPRFAAETVAEETEIATEFLPLTYTAQRDEQNAQIVRMEMPRSVLATLGVPVANVTGDRIKADVMLRDDGVALAIRFIQEQ